jgi:cytidylate kinase
VVISGLPGSGKSTLSKELANVLGWKRHSVGGYWRAKFKEEHPNGDVTFEEFWKGTSLEDNARADRELKGIAAEGNVVIDCRFTHKMDPYASLLVFLEATADVRAERLRKLGTYGDKTANEIKDILKARQEDELNMAKRLYGEDYDFRMPINYHVCINTGTLSVEQEIDIVLTFMQMDRR